MIQLQAVMFAAVLVGLFAAVTAFLAAGPVIVAMLIGAGAGVILALPVALHIPMED